MPDAVVVAPDPVDVFRARCEARAYLWQCGKFGDPLHADSLHRAVDALHYDAVRSGLVDRIGQNATQEIMRVAFAAAWPA